MFFSIFHGFGLRKRLQNRGFFALFSKTSISQKSCSRVGGSSIFKVRSLSKPAKNRYQNALEKSIAKKTPKNRFWPPFWPPKPFQNRPNIEKRRSRSPLENKSKNTSSANHRPGPGTTRKASLLGPRQTIQPPFQ